MINLTIGGTNYELEDLKEPDINELIHRYQKEDMEICISVSINSPTVNLTLLTIGCNSSGNGFTPNKIQSEIIQAWEQLRLNTNEFTGGNLIAFLKRIRPYS